MSATMSVCRSQTGDTVRPSAFSLSPESPAHNVRSYTHTGRRKVRYWKITHSAAGLEKRQNLAISHRGMTAFRPVVPRRFSFWCVIIFHCCIFNAPPPPTHVQNTQQRRGYILLTLTAVFCQVQPLQNQFSIFLRASSF